MGENMKVIDDLKQDFIVDHDKSDWLILILVLFVLVYGVYMIYGVFCCLI